MNSTTKAVKRLAGETAIYGLGTMVPRFLNYLLVPLYTIYVFTQAQYGQVTLLYSYVAILLVILTFGMETAFFRYANKSEDPLKVFNTATWSIILVAIVFIVLVLIFLKDIARLIEYPSNVDYVFLVAVIIALDAITAIPFAYLRFKNKALRFSGIRIISVVITISLNLIFLLGIPYYFGDKYVELPIYRNLNLVSFVFISNMIGSFSTVLMLWKEFRILRFQISTDLLKKMLSYGLPILIISLMFMISEVADKILLKYLYPDSSMADAQLGIYAACYKLAIIMMLFIQMFRYAAEPFFFSEAKKEDAKQTYSKVMTYFIGFTWAIFLMVTLYIDIFKFFIGEKYWQGLEVVPIILSSKLLLGVFYNLSVWYKLTNKTTYGAIIATTGGILTIVLNVILIPEYGYIGSAWANFVSNLVIMLISYLWSRRVYKVNYELLSIFIYSLLAFLIYILSIKINITSNVAHYIFVSFMFIIYISVVVFMEIKKNKRAISKY
jgi:O-antigen/teichoic acid export membrane protein